MAAAGDDQSAALSVRAKAEQDLDVLRARWADHERKGLEIRAEMKELSDFIRRYDRYDPPASGPVETLIHVYTDEQRSFRKRLDTGRYIRSPHLDAVTSAASAAASAASASASAEALARATAAFDDAKRNASAAVETAQQSLQLTASVAAAQAALDAIASEDRAKIQTEVSASTALSPVLIPAEPNPPRPGSRRAQVNDAVHEILTLMGVALTTKLLTDLLRKDAVFPFLGTKPEATLSSYLSRDPRFTFNRDAGGWFLTPTPDDYKTDQDGAVVGQVEQEGGVG